MAMNKKEQAVVEGLKHELRLARAFKLTPEVEPDVPIPRDGIAVGYVYTGSLTSYPRVVVACTSSYSHAIGRTDRTTSQGSRDLYSTQLLATQALRHKVEKEMVARLANIDKMIESLEV